MSSNTKIDEKLIKAQAVEETKSLLASSSGFAQLPRNEKEQLFRDVYREQYRRLSDAMRSGRNGGAELTRAFEGAPAPASEQIDDERHRNRRMDEAGQMVGDFVREVDFPGFVSDLLKGVFDANLDVTLTQMEEYQKLLKTATQSIAQFAQRVDPAAAFARLAESEPEEFSFGFDDEGGRQVPILKDKDGNAVDTENSRIKAKVMDATLELAREQRKLLRESILMGISRLVVEKGQVKASVVFDMKASEEIEKQDRAGDRTTTSGGGSIGFGGVPVVGSRLGGSVSRRRTQISVSSAKSQQDSELAAQLTGSVDIQFKSDYFQLDNFLDIQQSEIAGRTGQGGGGGDGGGGAG